MGSVLEEMLGILSGNDISESEERIEHYGMPRRSGRYPWGSGDNPYQHSEDFLSRIDELKKTGWKETPENIKEAFGLSTTQYRMEKRTAKDERRMYQVATAKSLKSDGLGASEIGRKMGLPESTVRSLLNTSEKSEASMKQSKSIANFLKEQVKEKGMIDVGAGVERELNISKEALNQALYELEKEGYNTFGGRMPQVTNPEQKTTLKVLCPPDTPYKVNSKGQKVSSAIYDFDKIHSVKDYISHDGGETFDHFVYPKSMDSKRLMIRYNEDGGINKDGVVEIRRGVPDLSLGDSHYAQVRILVDNKKYIKGMAVYSDDMPPGVDVIFNTNKTKDKSKLEVLKDIKDDPENPFGSLIKAGGQSYYIDKDGKRQLSLINKRAEQGDWTEWKDKVPSQFLSKQNVHLAKQQLDLAADDKYKEFNEIMSLTNPTVKKRLLQSFSDDCDSSAVHLQAAAFPGQKYHVIIPNNTLKDNDIYAPGYEDGTKLALVRYPHGGTFEIPICTVNNKNKLGKQLIGSDSIDAVCINARVAERLSGADFDGDTVMCIPTGGKVNITSTSPLKGLEGFDPKTAYPERPGMKYMHNTQNEMGRISNLITDMTLQGASTDELARAVRHSMVVIDAEKHKLDYKQSEIDNNIAGLKKAYQSGGASTLISRAKSQVQVDKRQGTPKVNMKGKEWYDPTRPEGSLIYKTADDVEYTVKKVDKRTGDTTYETRRRHQQSTKMAETDDARTLISKANTPMEQVYANYANQMKSLANQARKEMMMTGKITYSAEAKSKYQQEVDSLLNKLNTSLLNSPRERQAQLLANAEIASKKKANPNMSASDIKKASQQALTKYRNSVGAKRETIKITENEWKAIQAGAISENVLTKILNNADMDVVRQLATPKTITTLTPAKINKLKSMNASKNYTISQIAESLGVSTSTVSKYLKGGN